jgi:hypothetical protein
VQCANTVVVAWQYWRGERHFHASISLTTASSPHPADRPAACANQYIQNWRSTTTLVDVAVEYGVPLMRLMRLNPSITSLLLKDLPKGTKVNVPSCGLKATKAPAAIRSVSIPFKGACLLFPSFLQLTIASVTFTRLPGLLQVQSAKQPFPPPGTIFIPA